MARNMSLFNRRTTAKIKKGRDTKVAVDAKGSVCCRLTYNAILTIDKESNIDVENPNKMGKVSASASSLFISGNVIKRETAEKHNR